MPSEPSRAWVLTGAPENHAATVERGLRVIGLKEGRRNPALEIASGDRIFLYVTRRMAFAAAVRVVGELFEDRTPIWPGKPGRADAYPWRFPTEPEIVLDEGDWLPAEALVEELEHVRKWPREHWRLAFQGQIRPVSPHDAAVLDERMQARAGARA
ncbi:MAG TPA: EVE domain-containing protein [Solirubrobacteraceae bacterium]|nr:EVE domain-containing protein [Solirubrobacteraceae bacterium]